MTLILNGFLLCGSVFSQGLDGNRLLNQLNQMRSDSSPQFDVLGDLNSQLSKAIANRDAANERVENIKRQEESQNELNIAVILIASLVFVVTMSLLTFRFITKEMKKYKTAVVESKRLIFDKEKHISRDAYIIYLIKKYSIEKNDVLSKFICNNKLFSSLDDALDYAANEEIRLGK